MSYAPPRVSCAISPKKERSTEIVLSWPDIEADERARAEGVRRIAELMATASPDVADHAR